MLVSDLARLLGAVPANAVPDRDVLCAYTCDLLSWVMAKGRPGCAWVTVQTHMNVVAVASLHDMACVVHPEGIAPEAASLEKASAEGIAVLVSTKTAYELCALMSGAGIPPV